MAYNIIFYFSDQQRWDTCEMCIRDRATYSAAPRLSVMDFKVQAQVKMRMAGTMALKPSGTQDIHSSKASTRRAI